MDADYPRFSNLEVDVHQLPHINTPEYKKLEKDYLTAKLIRAGIVNTLVIVALLSFTSFQRLIPELMPYRWYITAVVVAAIIFSFISIVKNHHHKKYILRERDVIYRRGWLWRQEIIIPFNRIQHIDVQQGPIERMFDLGSLSIYTAGGSGSDLRIPGLAFPKAHNIKSYILQNEHLHEEE